MPAKLTSAYAARRPLLEAAARQLEDELTEHLDELPHIDRISCRAKTVESFVEKATVREHDPPYQHPLAEIEDQLAGRVIVFFNGDVDPIRVSVEKMLNPVESEQRRPSAYNEFDYESFHGVYLIPPHHKTDEWAEHDDMPNTVELQIRTLYQHAYAESQHDLGYKAKGDVPTEVKRELAWIAASSWGADHSLERVRRQLLTEARER